MTSTVSAVVSARASGRAQLDSGPASGSGAPHFSASPAAPPPIEKDTYARGRSPSARGTRTAAGGTLVSPGSPKPATPGSSPRPSRAPSRSNSPHGRPEPAVVAADAAEGRAFAARSRRPDFARMGSTASAISQLVPSAPAEVYAELVEQMTQAVRAARGRERSSLALPKWLRKVLRGSKTGGLHAVAGKVAGPHEIGLGREQTYAVVGLLARSSASRSRDEQQQGPVLAAAPLPQPSMRPVLWFCDALFVEAYAMCDPTRPSTSDEQAVLSLRRTGFALLAARDALESYLAYKHTPGHKHLPSYLGMVQERYAWTEQRQLALLQKERAPALD